jgi:beta-lactamase regulating signal transducer with metallopeptidase domain
MRTLLEYGLANAAAATALALVAVLVGLVVKSPAVRNALWLLVFLRLLLPPVWTVPLPVPAAVAEPTAPSVVLTSADPITRPISGPVAPDWRDGPVDALADEAVFASGPPVGPEPVAAPAIASPPATGVEIPRWGFAALAGVWAAGAVVVFGASARRIVRFRGALRDALPAPAAVQTQAADLARAMGLRRCPPVLVVPGRVSPALWMPGLFRWQAKLILPAGLLPLLSPEQRAAVLAHELSHLRRGDPWVRWLELIACGLYWWHPLLGWFRRQLRAAEEECCDMRVLAARCERRSYATALVETAAYLSGPSPVASPALASGAGPVKNLQRRVTMIMRATWPAGLTRFGLAAVLGIGSVGLAFGPALAQDRKDKSDPPVRDRDRDRDRDNQDRDRDRKDRADPRANEEIERAREAVEKARKAAREAMERLQEAEEKLARAEGRPGPGRFGPPGFPGMPGGRGIAPPARDPEPRRPQEPPAARTGRTPDPAPRSIERPREPGVPGNEIRDLQRQLEELRRAMEEMRREMRRGPDRGKEPPADRREDREKRPVAGERGGPGFPGAPGAAGFPGRPVRPGAGAPPGAPAYPTPPDRP